MYTKGLQLRSAILKEYPGFEGLCPDGPHIRKDLNLPEVKWNFPIVSIKQVKDEDDYHSITVGDVGFTDLFNIIISENKKLRDKNLLPLFVSFQYKQTKPDPIEVSIQNVVQRYFLLLLLDKVLKVSVMALLIGSSIICAVSSDNLNSSKSKSPYSTGKVLGVWLVFLVVSESFDILILMILVAGRGLY